MSKQFHLHKYLSGKEGRTRIDNVAQIAAFLYPLSGLPQLYLVMKGETEGVSLVSWICFAIFSSLFLMYGVIHRIKPMIIINLLWLCIDLLIILGVITHAMTN